MFHKALIITPFQNNDSCERIVKQHMSDVVLIKCGS